jgi:Protein of unknown function (DUF3379)
MNCLEFRRLSLADPATQDTEFIRHKQDCARCAAYTSAVSQLDKKLRAALQIDVPHNLASRIILRQSLDRDTSGHPNRRAIYALVAGLLLLIGLTVGVFLTARAPSPDRRVLAHIEMERELLSTRQHVTQMQLADVLNTVGAELKENPGRIRHASLCHLSKNVGAHLVFDGDKGPVIVLLSPKEFVPKPITIYSEKLEGMILPTANGSMAVVGQHGEDLQEVARKMRQAVTWRM